jgi:hypothetical protein
LRDFVAPFLARVEAILLANLSTVATTLLERALDYRRVGLFEMASQFTLTFVAVRVAFLVR